MLQQNAHTSNPFLLTARDSQQSHFPRLALLDQMEQDILASGNFISLEDTVFIGVQHLLFTTGSLFETLIRLGAKPENMYFAGKCYSTSPVVADKLRAMGMHIINGTKPEKWGEYAAAHNNDIKSLWAKCSEYIEKNDDIKKIIVLDDGGEAIEHVPPQLKYNDKYSLIGIEQTRMGIYSLSEKFPSLPVINVAQCCAKQKIESHFIGEIILKKASEITQNLNPYTQRWHIGVIGVGAIGHQIMGKFLDEGFTVFVYDTNKKIIENLPNHPRLIKTNNVTLVFLESHYVFGCTGQDTTEDVNLLAMNGHNKTLISCSSGDYEYNHFLTDNAASIHSKVHLEIDPTLDMAVTTKKGTKILVKNGGYPINFNTSGTSVSNEKIALTRGLILSSIYQSAYMLQNKELPKKKVMLNPALQKHVVSLFKKTLSNSESKNLPFDAFQNASWIAENSAGEFINTPCIQSKKLSSKL